MSRRLRDGIIALCILVACLAVAIDRTINRKSIAPDRSGQQPLADDILKYHSKSFLVIKVVDGDTIDIDVPDEPYDHTRIRLWGVDTPETTISSICGTSCTIKVPSFGSLLLLT